MTDCLLKGRAKLPVMKFSVATCLLALASWLPLPYSSIGDTLK